MRVLRNGAALCWLLLPLLSMSFIIERCVDEDGESISGCNCAKTNTGVYCPPNHYCPEYTDSDVEMYQADLDAASCTVDENNKVTCPCTPGKPTNYS